MTFQTTRRGLLRGTLGATIVAPACKPKMHPGERGESQDPEPPSTERVRVTTEVNGAPRTFDVDPDESALGIVRGELGLTGPKLSCGHGACGACTMLVDGAPRATCILPATALQGRKVETIEGLSTRDPKALHPVQRAFMAEDALQCGYCTPGFVTSAVAFHDRWRKEHGTTPPDRTTIAAGLGGNLCRCAAYDGIYRAVARACAGEYDSAPEAPARMEARDKVTGAARYTVDVRLPGALEAKVLRAPVAHGRIRRLDWSRAKAMPGVIAVLDLREGREIVRYAGQELCAVAAVDEPTAEAAIAAIDLEIEPLPPILGIKAGRDPKAVPVYPTRATRKSVPSAMEGPVIPASWHGNIRGPFSLFSKHKGAARRALAQIADDPRAGVAVEDVWRTQCQVHTALEPHACVAHWEGERLTVYLSTQAVHQLAEDLATRFGLATDDVKVIAHHVGGGFGAKATLQMEAVIAVELSRLSQRPVRYALDRREELTVGGNRPAQEIEMGIAASPEGELRGIRAICYADSGVAVGASVHVLLRLMYADAPKDLEDWDVLTHAPPGRPLRAPGGPPAFWALEQAVDAIAAKMGADPMALRRRWDPNPARGRLFEWAAAHPIWAARSGERDRGRFRRGVGMASGGWFYFAAPGTRLQLDAGPGGFVATTATQDIGNGTRTVSAAAIAGALGLPQSAITVRIGESTAVPGPMNGGSRTTASVVPAALHAVEQIQEELVAAASKAMGLTSAKAVPGGIEAGGKTIPWAKVLEVTPRISVIGRRRRDEGGYFLPPLAGIAPGRYVSGTLQLFEVEIDTRLGRIRPLRAATGVSVGKIQTPLLARSQVCGAVIQGISYALYEERRLDPTRGVNLSGGLEDYRIAGLGDVCEIDVHFNEDGYERVVGRSVGLGELATLAPAAAIGNAVFHATGWHPRELPLRPDRVLKGVRA
ncbi:MAG: molybdopterin-dependent oxidoreductase [Nannocystaceae bacterium]